NLSVYDRRKRTSGDVAADMQPDELSGSAIRQIVSDMAGLGFHLSFSVVDSADYGAAQRRLRFIMFGARDTLAPVIPAPTHGDGSLAHVPQRTVRDAIYDLKDQPGP